MSDWKFGDVWGLIAELFPARPAVAQGSTHLTWAEFDARASNLSRWLLALGIDRQAKVARYLYNSPAYLESVFACFKAGLVPTNTNYRYRRSTGWYISGRTPMRRWSFSTPPLRNT